MKICILGLDCAAPEIVFSDERLSNLRRLMELGLYGHITSVAPPLPVHTWMCMSASQDPGSLGIYGDRNRTDNSYDNLSTVTSTSLNSVYMWDQVAQAGKKSILVGVPPLFPPLRIKGISIGSFLTPHTTKEDFTHPADLKSKVQELVNDYPIDVKSFRTDRKDSLRDEIFEMSRKQWTIVKWLLKEQEWDYFQYIDIGLNLVQHGFWNFFDPQHAQYRAGNPYENVIPDYYQWLDSQVGEVLEMLDGETTVLVVSGHGVQRLDGEIALNQWLIEQDLLTLKEYPNQITPFDKVKVDWTRTKAWSEAGCYAQVFFNLQGREPQGVIPPSEYEAFQQEIKARFEEILDDNGRALKPRVFTPKEMYRELRNVAPDLMVQLKDSYWQAIGSVGHPGIQVQGDEYSGDGCSHGQQGMFILVAPNCPLNGEYEGAHLLDMAPTLLDLAGYEIPDSMQGRSLVAGMEKCCGPVDGDSEDDKIILDRLAGLGYV